MTKKIKKESNCNKHGEVDLAMICCHLFEQTNALNPKPIKYFIADPVSEDANETDKKCIWCVDCENVLIEEGEWNDISENYANPHFVCEFCLEDILEYNIKAKG